MTDPLLSRINEALGRTDLTEASAYRDTVLRGQPVDSGANEGLPAPGRLSHSLATLTGLDVTMVESFIVAVNGGLSTAAAASKAGMTVGQAFDLKGAMIEVGAGSRGSVDEEHIHEAVEEAVELRRTADFLYRLAEAADAGDERALEIGPMVVGMLRESLAEDVLDERRAPGFADPGAQKGDPNTAWFLLALAAGALLDLGLEAEAAKITRWKMQHVRGMKGFQKSKAQQLARKAYKVLGRIVPGLPMAEDDDFGDVPVLSEAARKKKGVDSVVKVIRVELNKALQDADSEEEAKANVKKELAKLSKLAGPNWRDAFKDFGVSEALVPVPILGAPEAYLDPAGLQKYLDMNVSRDAAALVRAYGSALVDNLPSSHPGRITVSFSGFSGNSMVATAEGKLDDGNLVDLKVSLEKTPYLRVRMAGLRSAAVMKLPDTNLMSAVPMLMQNVLRCLMQPGYFYTEVEEVTP